MKQAIALAGGGTKGAYQVGAWKAMRELGIRRLRVRGGAGLLFGQSARDPVGVRRGWCMLLRKGGADHAVV